MIVWTVLFANNKTPMKTWKVNSVYLSFELCFFTPDKMYSSLNINNEPLKTTRALLLA